MCFPTVGGFAAVRTWDLRTAWKIGFQGCDVDFKWSAEGDSAFAVGWSQVNAWHGGCDLDENRSVFEKNLIIGAYYALVFQILKEIRKHSFSMNPEISRERKGCDTVYYDNYGDWGQMGVYGKWKEVNSVLKAVLNLISCITWTWFLWNSQNLGR